MLLFLYLRCKISLTFHYAVLELQHSALIAAKPLTRTCPWAQNMTKNNWTTLPFGPLAN